MLYMRLIFPAFLSSVLIFKVWQTNKELKEIIWMVDNLCIVCRRCLFAYGWVWIFTGCSAGILLLWEGRQGATHFCPNSLVCLLVFLWTRRDRGARRMKSYLAWVIEWRGQRDRLRGILPCIPCEKGTESLFCPCEWSRRTVGNTNFRLICCSWFQNWGNTCKDPRLKLALRDEVSCCRRWASPL